MVNQLSREPRDVSDGPQGLPAVPGDSGPCPWACSVDQLSWATLAWVLGPVGRPAVPGDTGL